MLVNLFVNVFAASLFLASVALAEIGRDGWTCLWAMVALGGAIFGIMEGLFGDGNGDKK